MQRFPSVWLGILILSITGSAALRAETPPDNGWARVIEDDRAIKIETSLLEAVIPKKDPTHGMNGIEKGSFLDNTTGCREIGDGLMVVDWRMEAGSDEEPRKNLPDGTGAGGPEPSGGERQLPSAATPTLLTSPGADKGARPVPRRTSSVPSPAWP